MCEPTTWIDAVEKLATIGSAVVTLCAAWIAQAALRGQSNAQQWGANYDFLAKAYDLIGPENSILELHGVSVDELKSDGVSVKELVYILYQLEASDLYYRIKGEYRVDLSPYRKAFLGNEKVQLVWDKYLRDKFFHSSFLRLAVDEFIADEKKRRKKKIQNLSASD